MTFQHFPIFSLEIVWHMTSIIGHSSCVSIELVLLVAIGILFAVSVYSGSNFSFGN